MEQIKLNLSDIIKVDIGNSIYLMIDNYLYEVIEDNKSDCTNCVFDTDEFRCGNPIKVDNFTSKTPCNLFNTELTQFIINKKIKRSLIMNNYMKHHCKMYEIKANRTDCYSHSYMLRNIY